MCRVRYLPVAFDVPGEIYAEQRPASLQLHKLDKAAYASEVQVELSNLDTDARK